jgi:hypothetical protein
MNRTFKLAALVGMGLALAPWAAFAQVPAEQSVPPPAASVPVIPLDQQPTKQQLAKLFELMKVDEQLASVTKMMPALMQREMQAQAQQMQKDHPEMASMTAEQQQAAAKVTARFMERAMTIYPADEMIADMSTLYQKHLSRSDVDGIIAFYSSPAGQHMLNIVPVIMQEYMPMVMQRMQERMRPLNDEMIKEMGAIGKAPAPSADKPVQK